MLRQESGALVHLRTVNDLVEQHSNTFLYRLFLDKCCTSVDISTAKANCMSFFCDLLYRVLLVEASQERFYHRWILILQNLGAFGREVEPHTKSEGVERHGLLVLYASSQFSRRGFWLYSYEDALLAVMHFMLGYDGQGRYEPLSQPLVSPNYSLFELPRSIVRSVLYEERYPKSLRLFILDHLIRADSHDRLFWVSNVQQLMFGSENAASLLFFDEYIIEAYTSMQSSPLLLARTERDPKRAAAPPSEVRLRDITLDRIMSTAYLYLMYRLAAVTTQHSQLVQQAHKAIVPAGGSMLMRLFPLMIAMLRGDELSHLHEPLKKLYNNHRVLFELIAQTAEEVRSYAVEPYQMRETLIDYLYQRTYSLGEFIGLYYDTRHHMITRLQTSGNHPYSSVSKNSSWLYFAVEEHSFVEFLYDQRQELQEAELSLIGHWLMNQCIIKSSLEKLFCMRQPEQHKHADETLLHIKMCEESFVVLRFGPEARLYEISMSFETIARAYPKLFRATRAPDGSVTSRVFFVGSDCVGPYVVMIRDYLDLMRQTMFAIVLQSYRYHKNMPVFPIMARMWFGQRDRRRLKDQNEDIARTIDYQVQETSAISTATAAAAPTTVPAYVIDDHARHCVIQVLAHWLKLKTFTEKSMDGVSTADDDTEDESTASAAAAAHGNSKRKRSRATLPKQACLTQNCYIPAFGMNFFSCMRWLHRVANSLKQAYVARFASAEGFPNINTLNAIRGFLELYRPRTIRRATLESMHSQFLELPPSIQQKYADWIEWIRATLELVPPNQNGHEQWVPLEYNTRLRLKESTQSMFSTLANKDEQTAMLNWLFYIPIINNLFQPEAIYDLLYTENHVRIPDLLPLKDVPQLYLGTNSTPLEVDEYLSMYSKCFVTPFASSRVRLGPDYVYGDEPMHALMSVFRFVEQKVSRLPLRRAIENSMRNFDLDDFFAEKPEPSAEGVSPDERSLLPIQAQNARDINTGELSAVGGFVFYETSLPILALSSTEFVFMQERTASVIAGQCQSKDGTVGRNPTSSAANLFLDMVLRFHKYLKLEDIRKPQLANLSWKYFSQKMDKRQEDHQQQQQLCSYEEGPGYPAPYFGSPTEALQYIERHISPNLKNQLEQQRQLIMEQSSTPIELRLITRLHRWYSQIPLGTEHTNPRTGINETASFVAIMERERAEKELIEKQQTALIHALTSKLNSAVAARSVLINPK